MPLLLDALTSEGRIRTLNFCQTLVSQATTAGTLTLSLTSAGQQEFTGSTAGQIVRLGDATTYAIGHEWWILNSSSVTITVQDNGGTPLYSLQPTQRVRLVLTSNSTTAGVWVSSISSTVSIITGGTFIANYSSTANSNSNSFLNTFGTASSDTAPAVAPLTGIISKVTIMLSNSTGTGTFEFRVNTTTGTPAFTAVITNAQTATVTVNYNVTAGDQINCKIASGATGISKPNVNIYM